MEIPIEELRAEAYRVRKERLVKIFKRAEGRLEEHYKKCVDSDISLFSYCAWKGIFRNKGILSVFLIFIVLLASMYFSMFIFEYPGFSSIWSDMFLSILFLSLLYPFFFAIVIAIGSAIPLKKMVAGFKNYHKYFLFSFMYALAFFISWLYLLPIFSSRLLETFGYSCLYIPENMSNVPNGFGFVSLLLIIIFFWGAYRFSYSPAFVSLSNMGFLDSLVYSFQLTRRCGECLTIFIEYLLFFLFTIYILYRIFSPENPRLMAAYQLFGSILMAIVFSTSFSSYTLSAIKELKNWKKSEG